MTTPKTRKRPIRPLILLPDGNYAVPLGRQTRWAVISPRDYLKASLRNWCLLKAGKGYAVSNYTKADGTKGLIYLHREIMDAPVDMEVDHKNRRTLDNRRSNLRIVTALENQQNKGPYKKRVAA